MKRTEGIVIEGAREDPIRSRMGLHTELEEATIADLEAVMEEGEVTACRLVKMYVERIEALDRAWPAQRSTTSRRELPESPGTASNGADGRGGRRPV